MRLVSLLVLLFALLLSACATSGLKRFSRIKEGMDKTAVLDKLGSPYESKRSDGMDIWHYRFYDKNIKIFKEIQLKDNLVIYVGDPMVIPKPSNLKERLDIELKKLAPPKGDFQDVEVKEDNSKK